MTRFEHQPYRRFLSVRYRTPFIKHQSRMAYAKLMAMKLPIGSGAIESTVRRIVNLRLKGPSIFHIPPDSYEITDSE